MKIGKNAVKLVAAAVLASLLNACSPYLAREAAKEPLPSFEAKVVNLFWPEQKAMDIRLTDVSLRDEMLVGQADRYLEGNPYNYGNRWLNVYLPETVPRPETLPCEFSFPIAAIQKIEVYDVSMASVTGNITLLTGAELIIMGMTFAIIMAFKESCPFVYSWNGDAYTLDGETYSGAIFPCLERHDYLPLPGLKPDAGMYRLKLTNEVKEVQHTNLAELTAIDHPSGTSVLLDKYGDCHTYSDPRPPISAQTSDGSDVLDLLSRKDGLKYLGGNVAETEPQTDAITLCFNRSPEAASANLVLRAKSSFWLDYTLMKWFDLFGDLYGPWYRKQSRNPRVANGSWSLELGIPLSVFVEKNGRWEFVDSFPVTGPMADRDLVMPLDLSGVDSELLKIKLQSGFMFWECDYAALDCSPQADVSVQSLTLTAATDQDGKKVGRLMAADDARYQVMDKVGDQVELSFAVPPLREGMLRTVFLHGKGHYKVLHDPSGKPDIAYLEQFRQPGRLSLFSREKFLELSQHVKN